MSYIHWTQFTQLIRPTMLAFPCLVTYTGYYHFIWCQYSSLHTRLSVYVQSSCYQQDIALVSTTYYAMLSSSIQLFKQCWLRTGYCSCTGLHMHCLTNEFNQTHQSGSFGMLHRNMYSRSRAASSCTVWATGLVCIILLMNLSGGFEFNGTRRTTIKRLTHQLF